MLDQYYLMQFNIVLRDCELLNEMYSSTKTCHQHCSAADVFLSVNSIKFIGGSRRP